MPRGRRTLEQRNATLAVYLPKALLEELREVAEKDRRSASNQALIYIERALKARSKDE